MAEQVERAPETYVLTKAGYEQIQQRLAELEERRRERQTQIDDLQHDTDENYPEEAAGFEVATMTEHLDERIGHLRLVLETAEVVEEDPDSRRVDLGDRVTVWNVHDNQESTFDVLSGTEVTYLSDSDRVGVEDDGIDEVAADSPVGQALIGTQVGDVFDVATPDGMVRYAVRRIVPIAEATA